jgi:oxygen-independent coproporphyrinogen-3 oxidase
MCDFEIDLCCVADEPQARFCHELAALAELEGAGLLVRRGSHIAMTEQGRPFVRLAAAAFDAYLVGGRGRHSVAV